MSKKYNPGEPYDYQLTLDKLLITPKFFAPEQEIVYRDKVRYTYRDLFKRINKLGSVLEKLGVKKGDVIGIWDFDSHRYLEMFFAIPMFGAVMHTINWRLSPEQLIYITNHAEDKVVFLNKEFLPLYKAIKDKLTTVKKVIMITDDEIVEDPIFDGEYEALLKEGNEEFEFPELDENTLASIFYTTGTTGLPKGVYFTQRKLVLHTLGLATSAAYDSPAKITVNDVYMPLTPMFHVHAWGVPYLATLLGLKQVYPGKYEPEVLFNLLVKEGVTFSHCVPTILQMIVDAPVAKKVDLSKWKVIIGGARLPKGLALKAMDLGITVMAGYGMSETCPLISLAYPKPKMKNWDREKLVDILIKTGLPVPLVMAEVVDENDNLLPHDGKSTGELVLRAPWLTPGYYKDEEKTRELWRNGWLHTGDVAYIDEEGYIQITDRIKDVIKSGGEWVSSLDLENLMSLHPAVAESAAIGIPDEKWGERPAMIIVLKPEYRGKVTPEELKEYMKKMAEEGKIPKYGVPDRYIFVDELPKTSVGKIDKKVLRKKYAE